MAEVIAHFAEHPLWKQFDEITKMTADTTTALLILHEREKQKSPQSARRKKLVSALALAATLASECDRVEKPKPREIKVTHATPINAIYLNVTEASTGHRRNMHWLTCKATGASEEDCRCIEMALLPGSTMFIMNQHDSISHTFSLTLDSWSRRDDGGWRLLVRDFKPEKPERINSVPGVICIRPTGLCSLHQYA